MRFNWIKDFVRGGQRRSRPPCRSAILITGGKEHWNGHLAELSKYVWSGENVGTCTDPDWVEEP